MPPLRVHQFRHAQQATDLRRPARHALTPEPIYPWSGVIALCNGTPSLAKGAAMDIELPITIKRQPDYTTCGPTSLHAVYSYYGDTITLPEVIEQITKLEGGGTLCVHLATHALRRGYEANIWNCNVAHMDPTWFQQKTDIAAKLRARFEAKNLLTNPRHAAALRSIEEFFALGGKLHWRDLTPRSIGGVLKRGVPILTGTNGTFLYQCSRETPEGPNDVVGDPFGHFIVLCGYHSKEGTVSIADPLKDNPLHGSKYYRVGVYRLIGAIFLGAATDDGNLLMIQPKKRRSSPSTSVSEASP